MFQRIGKDDGVKIMATEFSASDDLRCISSKHFVDAVTGFVGHLFGQLNPEYLRSRLCFDCRAQVASAAPYVENKLCFGWDQLFDVWPLPHVRGVEICFAHIVSRLTRNGWICMTTLLAPFGVMPIGMSACS